MTAAAAAPQPINVLKAPHTWPPIVRLTDRQWNLVEPMLPVRPRRGRTGRPLRWSRRDVLEAILCVQMSGCAWRHLPADVYPHWQSVFAWYRDWSADGTLRRVAETLGLPPNALLARRRRSPLLRQQDEGRRRKGAPTL